MKSGFAASPANAEAIPMAGILGWRFRKALSGHHLKPEREVCIPMLRIGVGLVSGGWALPACTIYLLILCLRFSLNVGYLLVFSLAILMISAAYIGAKQLMRIQLSVIDPLPCALGAPSILKVSLWAPTPRANIEILCLEDHHRSFHTTQMASKERAMCKLAIVFRVRGVHPMPEVTVQTRHPLGVWRMFIRWQPPARCVVHPLPERRPPPIPGGADTGRGNRAAKQAHGEGELSGLRAYRTGEGMRQIAWRTFAKSDGQVLASRQREHLSSREPFELRLEDASSAGGLEKTLSRLTAWVIEAHQQGATYSLVLGGEIASPGQGQRHLNECLERLALHPKASPAP